MRRFELGGQTIIGWLNVSILRIVRQFSEQCAKPRIDVHSTFEHGNNSWFVFRLENSLQAARLASFWSRRMLVHLGVAIGRDLGLVWAGSAGCGFWMPGLMSSVQSTFVVFLLYGGADDDI